MRKLLVTLVLSGAVFAAPWVWQTLSTPITTFKGATSADAALIFGAVVRGGQISPLHRERLDTGVALWRRGTVKTLVVSNAPSAARTMQKYLEAQNVPADAIAMDTTAIRTPDTCKAEAARQDPRSVIFVSQKFHLPRIALHCARYGLDAQFVAADHSDRAWLGTWTTLRVRTGRWIREAALIWGVLLNLYPTDEGT